MTSRFFTRQTLAFLSALADNNHRAWFEEHKPDYESLVRSPALDFIAAMADGLERISPHFQALPKKMGGSLMRVHRDIRFGHNKQPFKTNIGIQFRHELGKDVHAPGYYLHVEPGNCFIGVGLWRPDATALGRIRDAIVDNPAAWSKARAAKAFCQHFSLAGESLSNAPRGYAKDHPLLEDLKRKDFIGIAALADAAVLSTKLPGQVAQTFAHATPFMRFMCGALGLQF